MENTEAKNVQDTDDDLEFFNYVLDLEEEWKQSQHKFTDKELLQMLPEARIVIPLKITEWEQELKNVTGIIKNKLRIMRKQYTKDKWWFWREVIKKWDGKKLDEIQKHLMRLRRQLAIIQNRKEKSSAITQEHIQQALAVSLKDIGRERLKLRRSGSNFVGLCPFHNERTPSFCIYTATNSFYCFGCQRGGNVINFIRELEGLSFRETIIYLTR